MSIRKMDVPCPSCGFDPNTLTPRQKEVENFLTTTALPMKDIAELMGVAVKTVEAHKAAVFTKHGVTSRMALVLKLRDIALAQ